MKLSDSIIDFYEKIKVPGEIPSGIEIMDPYEDKQSMQYVRSFYSRFFNDTNQRVLLVGINPGRFGGGVTGIPFTDPVNLEEKCKINNDLVKRHELSSKYIYDMIEALGGPKKFYSGIYITAVSPIGFVRNGKNLNYYDDEQLMRTWEPFMVKALQDQISFCKDNSVCYSLGQGKNFKYLKSLNERFSLFSEVKALPHPRWIMQYRLKRKEEFIQVYKNALEIYL